MAVITFKNFVEACQKRDMKHLNADVREGHLSAAISHLGNISYYLGEKNLVSIADLGAELAKVKSLDDNAKTLERTVAHLKKNGVDLDKYKLSLGPKLDFDPVKEIFTTTPTPTACSLANTAKALFAPPPTRFRTVF